MSYSIKPRTICKAAWRLQRLKYGPTLATRGSRCAASCHELRAPRFQKSAPRAWLAARLGSAAGDQKAGARKLQINMF